MYNIEFSRATLSPLNITFTGVIKTFTSGSESGDKQIIEIPKKYHKKIYSKTPIFARNTDYIGYGSRPMIVIDDRGNSPSRVGEKCHVLLVDTVLWKNYQVRYWKINCTVNGEDYLGITGSSCNPDDEDEKLGKWFIVLCVAILLMFLKLIANGLQ